MKPDKKNVRYNMLTMFIYIIGLILVFQLFNLQIVHGEEYYERSSRRLTRTTTIEAARGNILDRDGNVLAGTTPRYSVVIYRSRIENDLLNSTILNVINVLEQNEDAYRDAFPVAIYPEIRFTLSEERIEAWKRNQNIKETATPEDVLNEFKERYEITQEDTEEVRRIIAVRYGIEREGFTSMRAYVIATNISIESVAKLEEQSIRFPGVAVDVRAARKYYMGSLASHIIGYTGRISEEALRRDETYNMHDYVGKTGIEYVLESFLRGQHGTRQTDMSVDGTRTGEYIIEEAVAGHDVTLTISANLQRASEIALRNNIERITAGAFGREFEATAGSVVVIDVRSGEVLAMASYPDFAPESFVDGISLERWNEYNDPERKSLLNRTIQSGYAPGSAYKMVPAIAALEAGYITPTTRIFCGGIFHGGHNPRCSIYAATGGGHGWLDVSQAIKYSCNIFFYEVGTTMGIDILEEYSKKFGLGSRTNIELPGEISGVVAGRTLYNELGQTWFPGNTLSAVIRTSRK